MVRPLSFTSVLIAVSFLLMLSSMGCRQRSDSGQQPDNREQTEKKVEKSAHERPDIADVERGIRTHIRQRVADENGYFTIQQDSFDLKLKLVRVHTEYLAVLGPEEFFACVDLATTDGDVYDVDFFLTGTRGQMTVTRTHVHKLNGKPYYSWKQRPDKTWYTVPVAQSSNRLLGVIEGTDRFTFTYEVMLPELADTAHIWLPVAQSDRFQQVELLSLETPGRDTLIRDGVYGNRILHIRLQPAHSGMPIRLVYRVVRQEKAPYPEPGANLSRYLAATPLLPVGDRFGVLARQIINDKQATTPLAKARALYDYVSDNIRYAKQGTYGTGDANYACDAKSGNCTEFHSLFISLARSAGIPARFAVGAAIPSERNEGGIDGYHCWAEFYAEGKWWPVDISEANKYSALATYYFGHHPANRLELSRGRHLKPEPLPRSGPINFLAFPVLEVAGQPVPAPTTFTFVRTPTGN